MKERPILFTPDNAQKIFEGKKTQTRRIVKNPDYYSCLTGDCPHDSQDECHKFMVALCPYGLIGDRLWIREAWADLRGMGFGAPCAWRGIEEADSKRCREEFGVKWRPSIHMPRWACRTVVEIMDVRVERVQCITREDAQAEGVDVSTQHIAAFAAQWESIHGVGSWNLNPWVWCLTFRKVEAAHEHESAARHSRISQC